MKRYEQIDNAIKNGGLSGILAIDETMKHVDHEEMVKRCDLIEEQIITLLRAVSTLENVEIYCEQAFIDRYSQTLMPMIEVLKIYVVHLENVFLAEKEQLAWLEADIEEAAEST